MSNGLSIARRYALALYEEAERQNLLDKVDEDIEMLRASFETSRQLVLLFESPIIPREKKAAIIQQLFADRIHPITLRFLRLLIEKEREDIFPSVVLAFRKHHDSQLGITEARAKVPLPLRPEEEKRLIEALERITGKRIRLQVEQDPEMIGGVVVRVGDTVYDGSVRNQLASLREQFAGRSFVTNGG